MAAAEVANTDGVEICLADVEPARAVRWALRHLLDADVLGPQWLQEWIADELLARAFDYCPGLGCGGAP